MSEVNIAVVGATGAVGREMLKVLAERKFPVKNIKCLADPSEAGNIIKFRDEDIVVEGANSDKFEGIDIALFAVAGEISESLGPQAVAKGAVVIDNSSAFRMKDDVPLVVPEVNAYDIAKHHGIIANPNCSTIIMTVAINPIYKAAGLKRVVISTYQAVSGAGIAGLNELNEQLQSFNDGNPIVSKVFQHQIAFNLIPHIDVWVEKGYSKEEMKLVWESRKIMHIDDLAVSPTAVRVPVFRSHSESINLETEKPITPEEARDILANAPGVIVIDNPLANQYPMPLMAADHDEVYVGRIREDVSMPNGLNMWVVGDQIRKGAATNAIQIAEIVVKDNLF